MGARHGFWHRPATHVSEAAMRPALCSANEPSEAQTRGQTKLRCRPMMSQPETCRVSVDF